MTPLSIAGSSFGLVNSVKPYLLPDQAFPRLENAYVWRERVKKREGNKLLGRLQRTLTDQAIGNVDGAGMFSGNIISILGLEATSNIAPGSITIMIPVGLTYVEATPVDGTLIQNFPPGLTIGTINYATGDLTLSLSPALVGRPITITFSYYPGLPVMGIFQREISNINDEETVFFDTTYAYRFSGSSFQELPAITPTTWDGSDSDFFWATNYRGVTADVRLFFVTNFNNSATVPMRYYDGTDWFAFTPQLNNTGTLLLQARILIPYYGRLIALNTQEGAALGGGANFYNRCRFSQIGNPLETYNFAAKTGGWAEDIFGKGGFIDAPVNESIITAQFFKNTLIVFFERSTWQLRYVGEYGLPFLWERISSDFGSESTNSVVVFDQGVLAVGDKGIVSSNAITVNRIDEQIPDLVFTFRNAINGLKRVIGVRDFQKELVYWCYVDSNDDENATFPNRVLVYNYRNNTFAIFRDNITFFGTFQPSLNITWGSTTTFWGDNNIYWRDADTQSQFPVIVSGNQNGFVHYFAYTTLDEESMNITAVSIPASSANPVQLTIPNHNLEIGNIIYLKDLLFLSSGVPIATDLNDRIFEVGLVIDADNIQIFEWDGANYITNYARTPTSTDTYVGNGTATLFPRLFVQTKDFNPYQQQGGQLKISYIDFLTDVPTEDSDVTVAMTVALFGNTSDSQSGNLLVGNRTVSTQPTSPYYGPASDIIWHRFYATFVGQYIRVVMTYDDDLMNNLETHQHTWILNAMTLWTRPGGKIIF